MADSLQFHLYINNRSGKTLTFNRVNLDWGNFNNPENGAKPPVASIPPRTSLIAMIVTGAENSSSGTEGNVVYNVEGTGQTISMYWNVPWVAGTTNYCTASNSDEADIVWIADPTSDTGRVLSTTATFVWLGA
ncbi:aegerolysin family protein [Azospirillum doebereinerae]|uniref:Uncharacterized protein n=1 Tax=Azospirillum doebereinerae TaxID=92933 RepID=A0A433J188_9PROT|nr:aegerolysin family protein [Azospirillum doebereinerae]RUQ63957.1 hypothetical protein EJ913_26885 [Azospirillum doebereinerae]